MAVFLDLGRQRAAAWGVHLGVELAAHLPQHGTGEAHPIHGGVHVGAFFVEQVAVLDEQQRLHQHGRHAVEGFEMPKGVAEGVDGFAAAVQHGQARLGFFRVGGKKPPVLVRQQRVVVARLLGHLKSTRLQPLGEVRDARVAQPLVERPMGRKAYVLARPLAQLVAQGGGVAAGLGRLNAGVFCLPDRECANGHHQYQHQHQRDAHRRTQDGAAHLAEVPATRFGGGALPVGALF